MAIEHRWRLVITHFSHEIVHDTGSRRNEHFRVGRSLLLIGRDDDFSSKWIGRLTSIRWCREGAFVVWVRWSMASNARWNFLRTLSFSYVMRREFLQMDSLSVPGVSSLHHRKRRTIILRLTQAWTIYVWVIDTRYCNRLWTRRRSTVTCRQRWVFPREESSICPSYSPDLWSD